MTSSNGNILRVTGPLCGKFTGPGEFPTQRPVMRSFDVFFDLRLNKRLSKQPWGWWFETPSWSSWRHCNDEMCEDQIDNCHSEIARMFRKMQHVLYTVKYTHLNLTLSTVNKLAVRFFFPATAGEVNWAAYYDDVQFLYMYIFRVILMWKAIKCSINASHRHKYIFFRVVHSLRSGAKWVTRKPISILRQGINTLRPRLDGRHFPDDIFKCIFLNENE